MSYIIFFIKNKKYFFIGSWCEPKWIYNEFIELRECVI